MPLSESTAARGFQLVVGGHRRLSVFRGDSSRSGRDANPLLARAKTEQQSTLRAAWRPHAGEPGQPAGPRPSVALGGAGRRLRAGKTAIAGPSPKERGRYAS